MKTRNIQEMIGVVQRMVSSANHHLLERSGGISYLYGELAAIDEHDFTEEPSEIMKKLSGVAALLDAIAGSLDALAQDMDLCDREFGEILDRYKAA